MVVSVVGTASFGGPLERRSTVVRYAIFNAGLTVDFQDLAKNLAYLSDSTHRKIVKTDLEDANVILCLVANDASVDRLLARLKSFVGEEDLVSLLRKTSSIQRAIGNQKLNVDGGDFRLSIVKKNGSTASIDALVRRKASNAFLVSDIIDILKRSIIND